MNSVNILQGSKEYPEGGRNHLVVQCRQPSDRLCAQGRKPAKPRRPLAWESVRQRLQIQALSVTSYSSWSPAGKGSGSWGKNNEQVIPKWKGFSNHFWLNNSGKRTSRLLIYLFAQKVCSIFLWLHNKLLQNFVKKSNNLLGSQILWVRVLTEQNGTSLPLLYTAWTSAGGLGSLVLEWLQASSRPCLHLTWTVSWGPGFLYTGASPGGLSAKKLVWLHHNTTAEFKGRASEGREPDVS